jgi:hypothetical protein
VAAAETAPDTVIHLHQAARPDNLAGAMGRLSDMPPSEEPQDSLTADIVEAFISFARCQPENALRHAHSLLVRTHAIWLSHEYVRWAWPLGARCAHDPADIAATGKWLDRIVELATAQPRLET